MINTFRTFQERIEVEFWQFVIPRMKDKPEVVKRIVSSVMFVQKHLPKKSLIFQALFWICIGLSIGLGIGILVG